LRHKHLYLLLAAILFTASVASAAGHTKRYAKLDDELNERAASAPSSETTSVIVRVKGDQLPAEFKKFARPGRLPIVNGYVLDVPNAQLQTIAQNASTIFASHNATVHAFNFRTGVQSGAFFARRMLGFAGAGVAVATLDSGIAPVDDFNTSDGHGRMPGPSRVAHFEDFIRNAVTGKPECATPCDPHGHGTHVAGTIAGNGFDSFGEKSGMAPEASIVALRVLGKDGTGTVSGVLQAIQWLLDHGQSYNVRVVNMSFGTAPRGALPDSDPLRSLLDPLKGDPLAIATKALVDNGFFVVAAAGNVGQVSCTSPWIKTPKPDPKTGKCDVWGGITAPGTYPWVFTAGASSSMGTFTRRDDRRASFSSRGPAFPLQNAKPDLLAGGVGVESTAAPNSALYASHPEWLLLGPIPIAGGAFPYMALSGTSQAAAVVSGVAAQMLQANPRLTPNLLKAILEYTAQDCSDPNQHCIGYKPLEQGAGFLNALGAVRLARFYATAKRGQRVPVEPIWSRHFIWGNHLMSRGFMLPSANAWQPGVMWGVPKVHGDAGDNIVWGTACAQADCGDNIVWGTADGDNIVWGTSAGDNIVWGTSDGDNIVWGSDCGGADCDNIVWGTARAGDNIVWGTAESGDNIVWGTSAGGDNIVWGTADGDNIVWGTDDGDNIVWGTLAAGDNIVWGTAGIGDNIVWGTDLGDNIVWGTDGDNIVWGTGWWAHAPVTQDDFYRLFLNRRFAAWWVAREFGDRILSNDDRHLPQPRTKRPPRKD
jgi:serine protease AprX